MLKRTDVVLIKHFYKDSEVDEDQDPKYAQLRPGSVTTEPLWVYEPTKEREGLKGAVVTVRESYFYNSYGNMEGGKKENATLDLDELKDLDNALSEMQKPDAPWRTRTADEEIEMEFGAKDDFIVSAGKKDDGKEVLIVKAGYSSVGISFRNAPAFQRDIRSAIALLNSKG